MSRRPKVSLTVSVTPGMKHELRQFARHCGVSVSAAVTALLNNAPWDSTAEELIENQEDEND